MLDMSAYIEKHFQCKDKPFLHKMSFTGLIQFIKVHSFPGFKGTSTVAISLGPTLPENILA